MTTEETTAQAPVYEAPPSPPEPPRPAPKKKKKKMNKAVKRIITVIIVLLVIAAIGFALWYFLFREEKGISEIMPETAGIGTIQSTVEGNGNARAGATSAITVAADSTIREVFVSVGDQVFEGQPLYTAYSPAAEQQVTDAQKAIDDQEKNIESLKKGVTAAGKAVTEAQKAVVKAQEEVDKAQKAYNEIAAKTAELTTKAPFAGKLQDVASITPGQELSAGEKVATLVNDRVLKLTLYFSYAYIDDIAVGQSADVSVPALMLSLTGKVEEIHKVNFISPEGGIYFEVDISMDNPGTLAGDMEASAVMKTAAGDDIYPYANGKLAFSETVDITVSQTGPVTSMTALRNYTSVESGDVLLVQGPDAINEELEAAQEIIDAAREGVVAAQEGVTAAQEGVPAAQEAVTDAEARLAELEEALVKAQEGVTNLDAVAPISGSITSCIIEPGSEITGGTTVITISDTTNMTVEITVDDRNIPFVTPGMEVTLSDWNGNTWIGSVTKIDMENAQMTGSSGMTSYPVTLSVENSSGTLLAGMWLSYSFVTSESVDCVTVPIQCVKSIVDTEGNAHDAVFIQADSRPDNAIDFEPPEEDPYAYNPTRYPTPEEGYWPVPVVTGLYDRYSVEIVSGLQEGDVVFSSYMMTGAWS